MKPIFFFFLGMTLILAGTAVAGTIDFEDGVDGQTIVSSIPGLEFSATGNKQWVYGDWRTGKYQGPYPTGKYYSDGNFFAWLGTGQGSGVITFTDSFATSFTISYSAQHGLILEAYGPNAQLLDSATGAANLDTGQTDFLTVEGAEILWVKIREDSNQGNYWIIDDIDTDAVPTCTGEEDCDDGLFCNGLETCVEGECVEGAPPSCVDDSLFCNGEESCDEDQDACVHSGNPCNPGETCNEEADTCDSFQPEEDDDTPEEEEDEDESLWPEGTVTGGCCGCDN